MLSLDTVEVSPYTSIYGHSYNENNQATDLVWAPVAVNNGKLYQTHPFFKCKDYFNEIVRAERTGYEGTVYGFRWKSSKFKREKKNFSILIKTEHIEEVVKGIEQIIHPLEMLAGIELTQVFSTTVDDAYLLKMDATIIKETYIVSMHTMLIRLMWYYDQHTCAAMDVEQYLNWLQTERLKSCSGSDYYLLQQFLDYTAAGFTTQFYLHLKTIFSVSNTWYKKRVHGIGGMDYHNNSGIIGFIKALKVSWATNNYYDITSAKFLFGRTKHTLLKKLFSEYLT